LTIKEIKDGVVVVHNGQGLEEMPVVETEVVSLVDDGRDQASAPVGHATQVSGTSTSGSDALASKPPVRRPGQSQAAHQAALRAYWARRARQSATDEQPSTIKAVPTAGSQGDEGTSQPKITRRPLSTDQDKEEFKNILDTLRNLEEDPRPGDKTPEQIEAYKRSRQELMDRMTAHMRRANLRGNQPPSLGDRNEHLGGLRSLTETD
jgi:hypothetical protein